MTRSAMLRTNDLFKREQMMRSKLERVRAGLTLMAGELEQSERIRYTGWMVLLKRDGDGWKCVGVVNPDHAKRGEIPTEFDMSLPIPTLETLPEFTGW